MTSPDTTRCYLTSYDAERLQDENRRLRAALFHTLNYIENTESELGIKLGCGDAARAVLEPRK